MASLVVASGIRKHFSTGDDGLEVLKGIDLAIDRGEVVAIVGPSGVGKSTLLHILGGLDTPTAGAVRFGGSDVFSLGEAERARLRNRHIGFVFQFHHLLPDFTALENAMMPLLVQGQEAEGARARAEELLGRVGLEDRLSHLPAELSGGESQRVAVVRALVTEPDVVLADEPSGNLDEKRSAELHDLMWDLSLDLGRALVIVTHEAALADRADRVVHMQDGRVLGPDQEGI